MLGAKLLARQKTAAGDMLAEDIEQVSQMSLDTLCLQSAISLLDAGFAEQESRTPSLLHRFWWAI